MRLMLLVQRPHFENHKFANQFIWLFVLLTDIFSTKIMFISNGFLVHLKQAYQFSALLIVSIILYGLQ